MTEENGALPADYEACADCGFDHDYETEEANKWHSQVHTQESFHCSTCGNDKCSGCGKPLKENEFTHVFAGEDVCVNCQLENSETEETPPQIRFALTYELTDEQKHERAMVGVENPGTFYLYATSREEVEDKAKRLLAELGDVREIREADERDGGKLVVDFF
jgi:hypothetical protein